MLSTARRLGASRAPAVLVIPLIALLALGCSTGAAPAAGGAAGPAATAAAAGPDAEGDGLSGPGEQPGDGNGNRPPLAAPQPNLLIIKTGTMTLQVTGIDAALNAANQQIVALGGYVSGSERKGDGEEALATFTYRIPALRWDEALTGLRGLAEEVLGEHTSTEDVTGQVVDLGARIKNLQATEQALQSIMDRATEIKDVLAVQAELTKVRGEIEQLTGQKTNLEAQAAFSTLTVTFSLKPNPVLTEQQGFDPASEVEQASASLVGVLQALATAGIWFAIVWLPILLAVAIVVSIALVIYRRARRADGGGGSTPLPVAPDAGG